VRLVPDPVPTQWKRRALLAGGGLLLLVAAFVGGRYSVPRRVEENAAATAKGASWVDAQIADRRNLDTAQVINRTTKTRKAPAFVPPPQPPGCPACPTCPAVDETEVNEQIATNTRDLGEFRFNFNAGSASEASSSSSRLVDSSRSGWRASVAADPLRLSLDASVFRLGLERRLLGPLWIGASYQRGGSLLVSAAMEW
jgi:hypothetical protein